MKLKPLAAIAAVLVIAGCASTPASPNETSSSPPLSSTGPVVTPTTPTPSPTPTQQSGIEALRAVTAGVKGTQYVQIAEDNDPNDKLGRPNGYVDMAIAKIPGQSCPKLATSCGASVETWRTEAEAKARARYLQAIFKEAPMLGSEWDYVRGPLLLRVDGKVKPSQAQQIAKAFDGQQITV